MLAWVTALCNATSARPNRQASTSSRRRVDRSTTTRPALNAPPKRIAQDRGGTQLPTQSYSPCPGPKRKTNPVAVANTMEIESRILSHFEYGDNSFFEMWVGNTNAFKHATSRTTSQLMPMVCPT